MTDPQSLALQQPTTASDAPLEARGSAASDWRGWVRLLVEAVATSFAIATLLGLIVLAGAST